MSKQTEIFEFDDVDLVRGLCGPNHANLALIEEAFGVYIEAPGASCLLYTSPSPRDRTRSRMPSSA